MSEVSDGYWPVHLDPRVHQYPNVNLTLIPISRRERGLRTKGALPTPRMAPEEIRADLRVSELLVS